MNMESNGEDMVAPGQNVVPLLYEPSPREGTELVPSEQAPSKRSKLRDPCCAKTPQVWALVQESR